MNKIESKIKRNQSEIDSLLIEISKRKSYINTILKTKSADPIITFKSFMELVTKLEKLVLEKQRLFDEFNSLVGRMEINQRLTNARNNYLSAIANKNKRKVYI